MCITSNFGSSQTEKRWKVLIIFRSTVEMQLPVFIFWAADSGKEAS
jgi:hypothetical protein